MLEEAVELCLQMRDIKAISQVPEQADSGGGHQQTANDSSIFLFFCFGVFHVSTQRLLFASWPLSVGFWKIRSPQLKPKPHAKATVACST
jgi:hypothetical protein